MKFITGFEPTRIITREDQLSRMVDVLETTKHDTLYREDLSLLTKIGITTLRTSVPWHRIETQKGIYDWRWMDDYMHELLIKGIDPIMDPLHHVSIPTFLTKGFLDNDFVTSYTSFFSKVVERYPWVTKYTIINEPTVTTIFSCRDGVWYPHAQGNSSFKKGMDNIFTLLSTLSKYLQDKGREHWFIDSTEYHVGTCDSSNCHANYCNRVRYHLLDKLISNNCPIDVLGMDYYAHSEFKWDSSGRIETSNPIGFYELAKQYHSRYQLPIALTETNIRGFAEDRVSWFRYMYSECLKLEREIDFRGFCWYPFIDCTDWDSLLLKADYHIDPQGIILLDSSFGRHENTFSHVVKQVVNGAPLSSIPKYPFQPPLDKQLAGFIKKFKL